MQAQEIADEAADGPFRVVVLNAGGQSFDVRHLDQAELVAFLAGADRQGAPLVRRGGVPPQNGG